MPYNAAGMLAYQMGDVYRIEDYAEKCKEKFAESVAFFNLAGNQRLIALILAQIGFEYILDEKPAEALPYLLRADSIADLLQDTSIFSISHCLGITYVGLHDFSLAETYALKALTRAKTKADSVIVYYALSDVYIATGDYDSAYEVLALGTDDWTMDGVHYQLCMIEEGRRNFEQALVHLKAYQRAIDSTRMEQNKMHTIEVERKYNLEYAETRKNEALIHAQRFFILLLTVLTGTLSVVVFYQLVLSGVKIKLSSGNSTI